MSPLLLLALLAPPALPELELPALLSDGLVLQRETACPLWGRATPGERVELRASWGAEASTTADADGRWQVELDTPGAGGPHRIEVRAGDEARRLEDVWSGEVWLASGQSNMEWQVERSLHGPELLAGVDEPRLRVFDVARAFALEPATDCEGTWRAADPEALRSFSAVATFFGLELLRELDVPVGLVGSNWGGTPAEAWTSREGLADFPELAPALELAAEAARDPEVLTTPEELQREWWSRFDATDPGVREGWAAPGLDDGGWGEAELPGTFADHGLGAFDGAVWYRARLDLPAAWVGRDLVLELGPIDDMDRVFLDGRRVGGLETGGVWQTPRRYEVPAEAVTGATPTVAVCAVDTGGVGRVGGDAPFRVFPRGDEGAARPLPSVWRWRAGAPLAELGDWPTAGAYHARSPAALYNGMIAPLVPYALRGAIWYQGESNVARAAQYRRLFPALIRDWRRAFGRGDLPFYFVQIAPFAYPGDAGQAAELREAQALALRLPNTGMAVTMDVGDPDDIHPREKREVGRRLARWALARTYGREGLEVSGPLLTEATREDGALRLHFDHASGLRSSGGPLACFTVAGEDRVFHPAEAEVEGETVVVRSAAVPHPVAARLAWGAADEPNLVNGAGLPAPSFRTDDWPLVSAER